MNIRQQVREFMKKADQPCYDSPRKPTKDEIILRLRLICEECTELLDACYMDGAPHLVTNVRDSIEELLEHPPDNEWDVCLVADALADIDYVVEGARQTFGIHGPRVAAEVHRANMAKFGPGATKREDGKWLKPPNWQPPQIQEVLDHQCEFQPVTRDPWVAPYVASIRGFQVIVPGNVAMALQNSDSWMMQNEPLPPNSKHYELVLSIIDSVVAAVDRIEVHMDRVIVIYKHIQGYPIHSDVYEV